jgi:hypothetical protein
LLRNKKEEWKLSVCQTTSDAESTREGDQMVFAAGTQERDQKTLNIRLRFALIIFSVVSNHSSHPFDPAVKKLISIPHPIESLEKVVNFGKTWKDLMVDCAKSLQFLLVYDDELFVTFQWR